MAIFYISNQDSSSKNLHQIINSDHFGANLLITDSSNSAGSDIDHNLTRGISDLLIKSLRYPGGGVTEEYFSMVNPNLDFDSNSQKNLIPQEEFLKFCSLHNLSANLVIRTVNGFTETAAESLISGNFGNRIISQEYLQQVSTYVTQSILSAYEQEKPVAIKSFEIGNEFWGSGQMTASEYGRLASAVLVAADQGIKAAATLLPTLEGQSIPPLLVQSTHADGMFSPNAANHVYVAGGEIYKSLLDVKTGLTWTEYVIPGQGNAGEQLKDITEPLNNSVSRSLIGGIVDHYYANRGLANADSASDYTFYQMSQFEKQIGLQVGYLDRYITEWNSKLSGAADNRGLAGASLLTEIFYEMTTHGIDAANIWPLIYNSTWNNVLQGKEANITAAGAIFKLMSESLVGTTPALDSSTIVQGIELDIHGFFSEEKLILFTNNRSNITLNAADIFISTAETIINQSSLVGNYFIVNTYLEADTGGLSDNTSLENLATTVRLYSSNGEMSSGLNFQLGAIESSASVRSEITFVTNGSDFITGRDADDQILAAGGNDTLVGNYGNDTLNGEAGNDLIYGGNGDDILDGGVGEDIIFDGSGSDVMRGGQARDIFVLTADGVKDTITDFELGQDKLDLFAWGMPRDIDQLKITTVAHGVIISFGNETLTLTNETGKPIQTSQLSSDVLYSLNPNWTFVVALVHPDPTIEAPPDMIGTSEADNLVATEDGVQVFGLAGDDSITSNVQGISLYGGEGDDRYFIFNATSQAREAGNEGFDRTFVAVDYVLAAGHEIELLGAIDGLATTALNLTGNELSQTLIGNAGANVLATGGGGADVLRGGAGDDSYYVYNSNDRVYEAAGQGFDRVFTPIDFVLGAFQDVEVLSAANAEATTALSLSGNSYSQTIIGNAGANRLSSGLGSPDILIGGAGDDVYYVYNALDKVCEALGEGFDRVFTLGNYALGAGQDIELLGAMHGASTTALSLKGNEFAQTIIGNAGANTLRSEIGAADILIGGAGSDTYHISNTGDQVREALGNGFDRVFSAINYVLTVGQEVELLGVINAAATTPLDLTGNEKSQTIIGNAGHNKLSSGGGAADTLLGGLGDDIYYVFNPNDRVNEAIGAGTDRIFASVTYSLFAGQEVEMLAAANGASTAPLDLYGNEFSQTVLGNMGQNRLSSSKGDPDILMGGLGNDTYYVYNIGDRIVEELNAGFDKVFSAIDYTLSAGQYVELLGAISGVATDSVHLTGNELTQTIIGNAGDNTLSTGGGAADVLRGSLGNDSYYVSNSYDRVYESIGNGFDRVFSPVNYALAPGQEIEILSVTDPISTYAISFSGNSFSQEIIGNAGNNILSTGGGRADILIGGAGNDTYYVYNALDKVMETVGNGFDRVFASVNYTLGSEQDIEVLAAISRTATTNLSFSGNAFAQTIIGNEGENTFRTGGGAADVLIGGGGNDIYYISNVNDQIIEAPDSGIDTIITSINYTIAAGQEVEVLTVRNTASTIPLELRGNELDQTIFGNSGANILSGGGGVDILTGGAGADTFVFDSPISNGIVSITDFQSDNDRIILDSSIFFNLTAGYLSVDKFSINSSGHAQNPDIRVIYDDGTGKLWFDPDGSGRAPALSFAEVGLELEIKHSDFIIW